jgi:hypothetical protein
MDKVVPCLIPYDSVFYLNFFIKIKLVFDWIKSCSVWKFVLNPSRHCSLRPDLGLFFPGRTTHSRAAHTLACSPRVPPAPLLPHGAGHCPTDASLHRSRAAVGMPSPVLPLPPCGVAHTEPPHRFVFALDQAVRGPFFSAIAARRELSPTSLHTAPTSPPTSRIGVGVLLHAPEPLLPH